MSKPALEALKKRFKEEKEKENNKDFNRKNSDFYPFWKMNVDEEAHVRTLPFKGQSKADLPFVEKYTHTISINGEDKKVPCLKTYNQDDCPICAISQKYYKSGDKEKGKYFWRNRTSLVSVYITKDPLPADEETGENSKGKIKVTQFANQLRDKFDAQLGILLESDSVDDLPWDLENGLDFIIRKTKSGNYSAYDTISDFARKESKLSQSVIDDFEPMDLSKYIPKNPGVDKLQRMLDAHFSGEEYVEDQNGDDDNDHNYNNEETSTDTDTDTDTGQETENDDDSLSSNNDSVLDKNLAENLDENLDEDEMELIKRLRERKKNK